MTVKLKTPSNGSVSLTPQDTASDVVLTVPAATGTVITTASTFAGTGPAFRATGGAQNISNNTFTKVQLSTEQFDTASCFDNATNYRFTPNVAGYYQINFFVFGVSSSTPPVVELIDCRLYKNGSAYQSSSYIYMPVSKFNDGAAVGSDLVYMNGTTDYVELYARMIASGTLTIGGLASMMSGFLARAA